MPIHAYAAATPGAKLEPFTYEPGPLGDHDVDVEVEHCGICHSDLSMLEDAWEMAAYPFVPGHEVAGRVAATGAHVDHVEVGDRVGVGWHAGYCEHCPQCLAGDHNLCPEGEGTIVGRHGGFADRVRARGVSVIRLPDGVDAAKAGPLFCGGITVFNPLVQFGVSPTARVAVIGIGGLGHLALQFCRAWGCHVTACTSPGKEDEARSMGAHDVLDSRSASDVEAAAGAFDLVLSTVNASMDWPAWIETLRPKGRLHCLGAVMEPLPIAAFPMIMAQRSLSGSPVGSPHAIAQMLDFCARHEIAAVTEHFPMERANEALDHLRSGKARYRVVLDRD